MHIAEAGEGATAFYDGGTPEGAPAFWDTHAVPYRPNLKPEFCQARVGNLQCGARRVKGEDYCVGHSRKVTIKNEG
jgi:hypothetical protein